MALLLRRLVSTRLREGRQLSRVQIILYRLNSKHYASEQSFILIKADV